MSLHKQGRSDSKWNRPPCCYTALIICLISWWIVAWQPSFSEWDPELTLQITRGNLHNYNTEKEDLLCIKLAALRLLKRICQLLNLSHIQGLLVMKHREEVQPLAFVNCVSHIILPGTVNWKRSRGFSVLMRFPYSQVIFWIPKEAFLSLTFTDSSARWNIF